MSKLNHPFNPRESTQCRQHNGTQKYYLSWKNITRESFQKYCDRKSIMMMIIPRAFTNTLGRTVQCFTSFYACTSLIVSASCLTVIELTMASAAYCKWLRYRVGHKYVSSVLEWRTIYDHRTHTVSKSNNVRWIEIIWCWMYSNKWIYMFGILSHITFRRMEKSEHILSNMVDTYTKYSLAIF